MMKVNDTYINMLLFNGAAPSVEWSKNKTAVSVAVTVVTDELVPKDVFEYSVYNNQ